MDVLKDLESSFLRQSPMRKLRSNSSTVPNSEDDKLKSAKTVSLVPLLGHRLMAEAMEVDGAVVAHTVAEDMRLEADGVAVGMVAVTHEVGTAEDMEVDTVVDIMTAAMEVEEVMRLFHQTNLPIRRLQAVNRLLLFLCRMFVVIVMHWLIGQLPWSTSNQDLVELFQTIGKVERAEIGYEPSGRSRGVGVVRFEALETAESAIQKFQAYMYGGRCLRQT